MIKIISTDLDGTLMSTDHLTVTERTLSALKQAHDRGVKLAIATGRPMVLIDNVIKQVPFVDYVIYANGAGVFDRNENRQIYSDLIPNDKARELISYFLEKEVFFEVYVDGRSICQAGLDKYFDRGEFPQEFIDEAINSMDACESLLDFLENKDVEKITLYSVKDEYYDDFIKKMKSYGLTTAISFNGCLEGTSPTANKGNALKGICDALGFSPDEAMSFGDAGNDVPMLEYAEYSFAMGNASEECKKSAKFITDSNANDGVAVAVEKYVLNN